MKSTDEFKQTEIGLLPLDWDIKSLEELGTIVRGGSPRPAGSPRYFGGSYIPWLTVAAITNTKESELYVTKTAGYLTEEGSKHSRVLTKNTMIISNSGATLGVAKLLGIKCCANDGIAALIDQKSGNKEFICQYFNTLTRYLREDVATGNGQPNLNTDLIRNIQVPFPPEEEQAAIAKTLSDMDSLLNLLDSLISKKRDLKQAVLQKLLTGQTRLPGFSGEWVSKCLSEVASVAKGSQLKTDDVYEDGQFAHLNGGMRPSNYTNKSNVEANSIAISEGGNSCGFVQFMTEPYWCGGHCYSVAPRAIDNRFLYHALKSRQSEIMTLRVGSGLPNIQKSALLSFEFKFPESNLEQIKIAEVLSEMDSEIGILEIRRGKMSNVKQGMIQNLLTGKMRLV